MEQKRAADIFQELLDYLWNGLGLDKKPGRYARSCHYESLHAARHGR